MTPLSHPDNQFLKTRNQSVWLFRLLGITLLVCLIFGPLNLPAAKASPKADVKASCPPLLNHTFPRLQDDSPQNLCQYQGQVVLIVNTASYCGFTQQYEGLEKLYEKYRSRGLVVLGFPSNDFGNQEPGSNQQIAEFCTNTFGVKFPMVAKSSVKGSAANALFKQLAKQSEFPGWNFHKYVIDREGRLVRSFASQVSPGDRQLIQEIERALSVPKS